MSAALHDIGCQGKVSLFILALLLGFVGKQTLFMRAERPYIEQIFVIYHWNYTLLAGKYGGKAELMQGSIGEGVAINYGVF